MIIVPGFVFGNYFYGNSSVGRASVSKTECREFESLDPCNSRLTMKLANYIKESYNELVNKVSWPTTKELTNSAVIVLVASLILSLIIWLVDLGFEEIMKLVYGLIS